MALHFTTLASGSSANACLVRADDFAVLIDCGLGPRVLAERFKEVGTSWQGIGAVILTHTHGDHWNDRTFARLRKLDIPLYCHAGHQEELLRSSPEFEYLRQARLVLPYFDAAPIELSPRLRIRPLAVRHDGGPTFGFRIDGGPDLWGECNTLGYAADLGCWDESLVEALSDVELLALEFNHDVTMERLSGRSPHLIARVLGDHGHLSNCQAAAFLKEIVERSPMPRLRHVVQLHLSRECNRPELARSAARRIVGDEIAVHVASQHEVGPVLKLGGVNKAKRTRPTPKRIWAETVSVVQALLPGMDED